MRRTHLAGILLVLTLVAAACGGSDSDADGASDTSASSSDPAAASTAAPAATAAPVVKPEVSIPAELPTELVVTVLEEGDGPEAVEGDVVVVDYIGVRSADGVEFDNSYDRDPFPVTLGAGGVIPGWEQGLVGTQADSRVQLDIPADLAYGDAPQGDVIRAGDALTFVVDVRAIIPATGADDEPTETIEASTGVESTELVDLVTGEGDEVAQGSLVFLHLIAYNGETAEKIDSTWPTGEPASLAIAPGASLPGIIEGLLGMKAGGRRVVTIPPAEAFGEAGNEQLGLPAGADLILVLDVLAVI